MTFSDKSEWFATSRPAMKETEKGELQREENDPK